LNQYPAVVICCERFQAIFAEAEIPRAQKGKELRKRQLEAEFVARRWADSQTDMQAAATRESEAELIRRILAGEKELFHDLIRPYERMVYLTVLAVVKNEADAEDGAQEAVINAYRHLSSFRAEAKFSTWLTTIAINEGRKRLRRAKGAAESSIEEELEEKEGDYTPAPLTDWREIPLEALERKELREALRKAVASLPDIYRQVFTLRDMEELNIEETAEALRLNPGVVKVRLHRARILLQKQLVPFLKSVAPARKGFFRRTL
jgi:RNA polymerase sigma-70 factor, ECF subfamily